MRIWLMSDPKAWRERAEQCRTVAEAIHDATSRAQMMSVADAYDSMAMYADRRSWRDDQDRTSP